jgi:hypothetical protein
MKVDKPVLDAIECRQMPFGKLHCIALGERGRGRREAIVPVPEQFHGLEPGLTKSGQPRLNACGAGGLGWIVRVKTLTSYIRGACGYVDLIGGASPEVIARGNGAFGDAGRIGTWVDLLLACHGDCLLRIKPSRGKSWLMLVRDAEGVIEMSVEEYKSWDDAPFQIAWGHEENPFSGIEKETL